MANTTDDDQVSSDTLDIVLQQSQMVFFCIPFVGPFLAAGASIWEAVREVNKVPPRQTYSIELAIADLGDKIENAISETVDVELLKRTKSWQLDRGAKDLLLRDIEHNRDAATVLSEFGNFDSARDLEVWASLGDDETAFARWEIPQFNPGDFARMTGPVDPFSWGGSDNFRPNKKRRDLAAEDVERLGVYCMAHTAYQARCLSYLKWGAAAFGYDNWTMIAGSVRSCYEQSLILAIDHLTWVLTKLKDTFDTMHTEALGFAKDKAGYPRTWDDDNPAAPFSRYYTEEIRRRRNAVFLSSTTPADVATYISFLGTFGETLRGLRIPENSPTVVLTSSSPTPTPAGKPTGGPVLASLGARGPQTLRFLYESNGSGGYIDIVANPTVLAAGFVATQNAGSAKGGIYYQVGGLGLNLQFATQLALAGQLDDINSTKLPKAYNDVFGTGEWEKDSVANPTRQDRLTSVLIPLADGGPVGDRVIAMMYSASPLLGASGLSDAADASAYTAIYSAALDRIATWNLAHPSAPIVGFRVTLLSTGINSSLSAGPALDALRLTAATLMVNALLAKVRTTPALAGLTILLNNSDATGGSERVAFDGAATAALATQPGVVMAREGFDIPF